MNALNIPAPHADAAIDALRADGPLPAYREHLMLFGQFVGIWDMDISFYDEAGQRVFQGVSVSGCFRGCSMGEPFKTCFIYANISDLIQDRQLVNAALGRRCVTTMKSSMLGGWFGWEPPAALFFH